MKVHTVAEIAEIYRVLPASVRNWIGKGCFPNAFYKRDGRRQWLIPDADLQNFRYREKGGPRLEKPTLIAILTRDYRARKSLEKSHGYGEDDFLEMIRLNQEGLPVKEIAERFGAGEQLIEAILERAAVSPLRIKKKKEKKEPKRFPKELLTELYVEKKLLTAEILERLGTNYASLYINLRHWGIPFRDGKAKKQAGEYEKLLRRLYVEEKLSFEDIAGRLKQTVPYIRRKLRQLGIIKP